MLSPTPSEPAQPPEIRRGSGEGARRQAGRRGGVTAAPPRPIVGAFVRAGLRAMGLLPLRLAHAVGALAGRVLWLLPSRARRVSEVNLALAMPGATIAERAGVARRSLEHLGRMAGELGILWTADPSRVLSLARSVEGGELFEEARAAGRGVLVATPHLGSWEFLLLHVGALHGIATLYRPQRIRELDEFVREARQRTGARMIPPGAGALREFVRLLASGGTCGIACDQDPGEGAGIFVPFLGQVASTMTLPGRLAGNGRVDIIIGIAERLAGGEGFAVRFERASADAHSSDAEVAARGLNADLEAVIRRHPEQYLWSYKRFRIRPDGSPDPYRRHSRT